MGVVGAPEMATRYLRSDPDVSRRASLSATLYSTNAVEYAAGFFLSWTVPGPLAAHAAHFTNRFRVCLAAACLAGENPLDPRTVATAAAVCAGADAARVRDAGFESAAKHAAVAEMELREGKIPMVVRRYMPTGAYEDWPVEKLVVDS